MAAFQSSGMFSGLAGVAFASWSLSRGRHWYRRLVTTLTTPCSPRLATQARDLIAQNTEGLSFGEFDVISGLAGAGAYVLAYLRDKPADTNALAVSEAILGALVHLAGDTGDLPCWWTPLHFLGSDEAVALASVRDPQLRAGRIGIPGPSALMALALPSGITVTGLEEAIDRSADWLECHRADDAWGVNWPYAVPLSPEGAPDYAAAAKAPGRAAWCYAGRGSRALAGRGGPQAASVCNLAIEAMEAVYRRPVAYVISTACLNASRRGRPSQITLRFANDTRLPVFAEAAVDLFESLNSAFEPDSLLGYRSLEPGDRRIDQPGLLDGAPGVLLTLLASCTDVEPS